MVHALGHRARRLSAGLLLVLGELIPFEETAMAQAVAALGRSARKVEALSLVLIVWGSSAIFVPVEMALNRAWGGRPRAFWRSRLLAFGMTVAGGLLAFAFAMLEVSDSLILAQKQAFYPITKAIMELFQLLGDGKFIASALGVWAMAFLGVTIVGMSLLLGKKLGAIFRV